MTTIFVASDANRIPLPDKSVHCIVTSPPYWLLRSYLPKDHPSKASEMGQEKTPKAFIDALVQAMGECRRVLRDDGVLWVNIDDSYARSGGEGDGTLRQLPHMSGKQGKGANSKNH